MRILEASHCAQNNDNAANVVSHLKLIEPLDSRCEAEVAHITSKRRLPVLHQQNTKLNKVNPAVLTVYLKFNERNPLQSIQFYVYVNVYPIELQLLNNSG